MESYVTYARAGYHCSYLENAVHYYEEFKNLEHEYQKSKTIKKIFEHPEYATYDMIYKSGSRAYFTCIVFFFFLEAYIYDFAARRLGDSYVKNYLDKLDFISKWVIVPRLITAKQLDVSRNSFSTLKKVISVRNKLVHHKSTVVTFELASNHKHIDEMIDLTDIINSIRDIFKQLESFDLGVDVHELYIESLRKIK